MAKKNQVFIDVVIDDKGTTKRVAVNAKKLGIELDKAGVASDKASRGQDKLNKSSKDLDRNMRGTAKMTSNGTKEFSKMSQGMGGLVGVYATLAAQVFAVSAAFQFLQGASDFRNLIAGQEALGAVSGTAYKTITNSIIEATDAQIKYADAARAAAIGSAAGLTSTQLTELGEVARNASFALGRDLTDSFNRLVRGVTKAEPELLDELGIILRLETATEKYAEKIGETASNLTAFQRSQAVANEVLEQGERKFAAIEALMDPNAAALQQFAKSFDDLFNSFKVGVIEGLTPVLQFLSKNTLALTASLALFAIPIIKAIIPNLDEWRKNSKLLYDEHKEDAAKYMQRSQEQSAILKTLTNDQDELEKSTRATIATQGKAADKGGLGFVAGGTDSGQARAAARQGLKQAEEDLRKHGEVRNGIFKGFTAKEVAIARASYNQRAGLAEKHTALIKRKLDSIGVRAKIVFNSMQTTFSKAMAGMTKVAAAGARAINIAMSLAGLIGVITMVGAGLKAVYDYFFPLSEVAQRQAEQIDNLTDKYKDLGFEMERAREARETLTTGSMSATNIGQVLQSVDVAKTVENINQLANMVDKGSEGFVTYRNRLLRVTKELSEIDPKFKALEDAVKGNAEVNKTQGEEAMKQADSLMETGAAISGLPETIGAADKAFTSLYATLIKKTPIDTFLNQEELVVKGLGETKKAIQDNIETIEKRLEIAAAANKKQAEADEKMINKMKIQDKDGYRKKFALMDEEEKKQFRLTQLSGASHSRTRGEQIEGTMTKEQIDEQNKRIEQGRKELTETTKLETERSVRQEAFNSLKTDQLSIQKSLTEQEIKATETQTRGVTIEGKLANLDLQKVSNAKKLRKVIERQQQAQTAFNNKKQEDKGEAKEALDVANRDLRLARAQFNVQNDKVIAKQEELRLEKELLALKIQEMNLANENRGLQAQIDLETQTGGGGFQSAQSIRAMTQTKLENEVEAAKVRAKAAAAAFDKAYKEKFNELEGEAFRKGKDVTNLDLVEDLENQAEASTRASLGDRVNVAEADVTNTTNALTAHKETFSTMMKTNAARIEALNYQTQNFAMTKEAELVNQRILELRSKGVDVSEEQRDVMLQQAQQEVDIERNLQNMQGLRDTLKQGMTGAFESMITGAKSAKEAFADMAKSMLMYLAKIIAQELALKAIRSLFGGFFADGGVSMASGGITSMDKKKQYAGGGYTSPLRNYSRGGMARGPQQGYNAVLHGNEAVVPLPDNRHIPVEMSGSMGQQNNVTVNVNMDNSGGSQTSSQSNGQNAERMGALLAKAVQDELHNQKRSGGILSPYGAT